MAFHIPFNQRRRARQQQRPVYIGFDVPVRVKRKFNWWGFNGLMLSMGSFLTAGFASPVALLVSLVGLRKSKGPRKAAVAGTVFSLIGILMAGSIVGVSISEQQQRDSRRARRAYKVQLEKDLKVLTATMGDAKSELVEYRESKGFLPDPIFGNMLTIKHNDPWGKELRFEDGATCGIVRSAGPDADFDTDDDVVLRVKGELEEIGGPFGDEVKTGSVSDDKAGDKKTRSGYSKH